jgi:hypothetical protein
MNKPLEIICNITAWLISLLIICLLAWAGFAALERMQAQSGGIVSEGQP